MPGTNFESEDDNFEAQDVAETLDEDKFSLRDTDNSRRTFEEEPEVPDLTQDAEDLEEDDDADNGGFHDGVRDDGVERHVVSSDADDALDDGLDQSFPASDPVSLTRRED